MVSSNRAGMRVFECSVCSTGSEKRARVLECFVWLAGTKTIVFEGLRWTGAEARLRVLECSACLTGVEAMVRVLECSARLTGTEKKWGYWNVLYV